MNLVFGIHAVNATLDAISNNAELLIARKRKDSRINDCIQKAKDSNIPIKFKDIKYLDKLIQGNHQGIILQYQAYEVGNTETDLFHLLSSLTKPPLLLILDGITDPHNLGACLRTADGAGVDAVITPKTQSAGISPVVLKVASGAKVPFFQVTNLSRILKQLTAQGIWIIGTDDKAETDLFSVDCQGATAFVLGNEGSGLRRLTKENCQQLINIPMAGSVSSLNVSVATGVVLYQAVRQRMVANIKSYGHQK